MPRRHLFEFNELPSFPQFLRDAMTGYLEVCYRVMPLPDAWADKIAAAARAGGETRLLDLCSGAGGPALKILPAVRAKLGADVELCLTDLFPNPAAIERVEVLADPQIQYESEPVDAQTIGGLRGGVRTIFAGLHHFRPAQARAILESAFRARCAICVFEVSENSWRGLLAALPIPILVLLLTPLVRPLRPLALVLTYILPILPLVIWWDGLVSQLRTYSPAELEELTLGLDAPDYEWDIGAVPAPGSPLQFPYLVGRPKS